MKNSSWYPTYRHHHREGNKGSTEQPPREPNRALQNPLNGDERDGAIGGESGALTVTMAVSARKCESSTVPMAPRELCFSSPRTTSTQLAAMEAR